MLGCVFDRSIKIQVNKDLINKGKFFSIFLEIFHLNQKINNLNLLQIFKTYTLLVSEVHK